MYDAELIVFAAPVIHCLITFPLYNLWHRFKKAYQRGLDAGVNIFENKYIEVCVLGGSNIEYVSAMPEKYHKSEFDKKHRIWYNKPREKVYTPYFGRQHNIAYDKLNFIKSLGLNLDLTLKTPMDPTGPTREQMSDDHKVNQDIANLISHAKKVCIYNGKPDCTEDEFVDFLRDDNGEFGRGMTLSKENLTRNNVINNIKFVRDHQGIETITKGQIILCMKERADRAGHHDLSTLYYEELFRLIDEEGFRFIDPGLHRPSNY